MKTYSKLIACSSKETKYKKLDYIMQTINESGHHDHEIIVSITIVDIIINIIVIIGIIP